MSFVNDGMPQCAFRAAGSLQLAAIHVLGARPAVALDSGAQAMASLTNCQE
jgi:hypothetical protein